MGYAPNTPHSLLDRSCLAGHLLFVHDPERWFLHHRFDLLGFCAQLHIMKNTYLTLVVILFDNDGGRQEFMRFKQKDILDRMSHEDSIHDLCQCANLFHLPSKNGRYHCYWEVDEDV